MPDASSHTAPALRRENRELRILNAVAAELNASLDLDSLMGRALAQVAELLDLSTGWVFLLDEASGEPYLAASQNLPPGLAENPALFQGSCYCLDTYREGDLDGAANVNVVACSRLRKLLEGTGGLRYHASIPLYARDRQLGVLNVASTEWRRLDDDDLRLLLTVGDMLSLAIERALLYRKSLEAGVSEERNRLAREIHDTLAQSLAAITLHLEAVEALVGDGPESAPIRRSADAALKLARQSLEEARRSVLDLRAAPLEGRRLADALADLCEETRRASPELEVSYTPPEDARPLPSRLEVGLYRIAQEALGNVRRHAAAAHVGLRLRRRPDRLELEVADDGRGFDPDRVPEGCFGLVGLRERAHLLDGSLEVESSPGVGTRVVASVPLSHTTGA